jgi:hypothetical protein
MSFFYAPPIAHQVQYVNQSQPQSFTIAQLDLTHSTNFPTTKTRSKSQAILPKSIYQHSTAFLRDLGTWIMDVFV